jgi:hypothetical protein
MHAVRFTTIRSLAVAAALVASLALPGGALAGQQADLPIQQPPIVDPEPQPQPPAGPADLVQGHGGGGGIPDGPGDLTAPQGGGGIPDGPGDLTAPQGGGGIPDGPGDLTTPEGGGGGIPDGPGDLTAPQDGTDPDVPGDADADPTVVGDTAPAETFTADGANAPAPSGSLPYTGAETWMIGGLGALFLLAGAASWRLSRLDEEA